VQRRARIGTLCKCEAPDSIGCSTQPIGRWLGQSEIKKKFVKNRVKNTVILIKMVHYNVITARSSQKYGYSDQNGTL